jgi:nucleoside-diphosphate-sugar epimerase
MKVKAALAVEAGKPLEIADVDLMGPRDGEVLVELKATGVCHYVFISSIGAYAGGTDLDEDAPLVPDDFPNPYGAHKAGTERMLFRMHRESEFPATTFRPPFVYGPRQPFYREQFFWDRMRDGRPIILPDGGDTLMQWGFAPDIAVACARSIEIDDAIGEAFNIGHEDAITQRAFVEALARVAGTEPRFVAIPRAAIIEAGGQLVGDNVYFGEYLDLPPITTRIDKARRILGFEPTLFEAALGVTRDWYLTQPRRPIDYSFEDRLLALA